LPQKSDNRDEDPVSGRPSVGLNISASKSNSVFVSLGWTNWDLLQLHRIDPNVPLEDQIGVLSELQREEKNPSDRPVESHRAAN
jgi:hypothetical protein